MEIWGYYRVLRRRRWLVLAALVAAVGIAFALNRPAIGDYAATATLAMPSPERTTYVSSGNPTALGEGDLNARTAIALSRIRSREVAERVGEQLGLTTRPEDLIRRITPEKDPISNLIKVSVTAATPEGAIALANQVAETAAAYDREVQRREVTLAREFVERQAYNTRNQLQAAENALLNFQQRNALDLAIPRGTQAAALASDLRATEVGLQEVQARLTAVVSQMSGQNSVRSDRRITENPIAQQLRGELVQLEVALTSELAIHTDRYPAVVALKAKVEAVKDRLRAELNKVVSAEQVRYNPIYDALSQARINQETEKLALLARRDALQQAMARTQRELPGSAEKQMELARATRDVEILGKDYSVLQGQLAQARIREQEVQNLGSLSVVDHARTAQLAPFSGLRFKLTIASVLGLLGGVALAFLLEYLDNTLKTPEQAERILGVPALATIPRHNPPFDEAYRLLRANLTPYTSPTGGDVIVLNSPKPRSGTSTVVANLARAFAGAGQRTVIVDANLRRPTQHTRFGVTNDKGVIEVLSGAAPLEETLIETGVPNLRLLPSGTSSADVGGLISTRAVTGLFDSLKRAGDVILVDAPPAGAFSDALALAPLASGVLFVLEAGRAPRGVERQVKIQMERLGAKVLGVVVTKVTPDLVDSYYYQRFYRAPSRNRQVASTAAAAAVLGILLGLAADYAMGDHAPKWLPAPAQHTVVNRIASLIGHVFTQ